MDSRIRASMLAACLVSVARGFPQAAFSEPTFAPVDHKNDFCPLAAKVNAAAVLPREALQGASISVAFPMPEGYSPPGFFELDDSRAITDRGLMTEVLDEVARRGGFTWRDSYGFFRVSMESDLSPRQSHDPPRRAEGDNYTWTDALVWSATAFDVSIEWWGETVERKNLGVIFPQGFYDGAAILVTKSYVNRERSFLLSAFSWLQPFSPELWVGLGCLWVWVGIVYYVIEQTGHCQNKAEFVYDKTWKNLVLSIQYTSLEWAGLKWHTPKTMSGRFFALTWLVARLLIISCYTANLASTFVSNAIKAYPVNSVEEAIALGYKICIPLSTYVGAEMQRRFPQASFLSSDGAENFVNLREGSCAAVVIDHDQWRSYRSKQAHNPGCTFEYVGRPIFSVSAGFALMQSTDKCTHIVRDVLDIFMQEIILDGTLAGIWEAYEKRENDQECVTTPTGPPEALGFNNLGGLFVSVFASGILVIILNTTCTEILPSVFGHWGTHEHAKHDLHAAASPLSAALSDTGALRAEGAELVALLRAEQAECTRRFHETERRLNAVLDLLSRRDPSDYAGAVRSPIAVSTSQPSLSIADLSFPHQHRGNSYSSRAAGAGAPAAGQSVGPD